MIRIVINGKPVPKGRPRMTRTGHAYTPEKTRNFENHGRVMAQLAMNGRAPLEGQLQVSVYAVMPIPKSFSKADRTAALLGTKRPTTKPDLDNMVKSITDACDQIVYKNDSQIVSLLASKCYGVDPCMVIEVAEYLG